MKMFGIYLALITITVLILIFGRDVYAVNEARVNITVFSNVEINFSMSNINFGYGSVSQGYNNATIDSTGNVIHGNWSVVYQGFIVENTGNWNATVNIRSDKNASEFIGGSNPGYYFNITNIEQGSCVPYFGFNLSFWYDLNSSEGGTSACQRFNSGSTNDSIRIDIRLVIPSDSNKGVMNSIINAIVTAV